MLENMRKGLPAESVVREWRLSVLGDSFVSGIIEQITSNPFEHVERANMSNAELGEWIRELLASPGVDRVEIYGKVGKESILGIQRKQLVRAKMHKAEQIRPKS